MKKYLLLSTALMGVALVVTSQAQVGVVPQVGLITNYLAKVTYSSAFVGLVPVTAGTDVLCIAGSSSKTVRLMNMTIAGTAATAVQSMPVVLVKRVIADTGGTAASTTANPGTTTQIMSRSPGNPAATATLISYVANPTISDSSPTYLASGSITMPIVTSVVSALPLVFDYSKDIVNLLQPPTLTGAAMQICANIQGVTVTNAAAWNGSITWTEE